MRCCGMSWAIVFDHMLQGCPVARAGLLGKWGACEREILKSEGYVLGRHYQWAKFRLRVGANILSLFQLDTGPPHPKFTNQF